ncbi:MAG: sulfatase-like hydrolase/transferase [Firmicutes bacterium]|nr:sulfatase-like hydrolase/transferase [Bacillota bacterium]
MQNETEKDKVVIKTPPAGYYLVLSLGLALFWLIQDALFRYNGLLHLMKPVPMLKNALVVLGFFILQTLIIGLTGWLLDSVLVLIHRKSVVVVNTEKTIIIKNVSGFLYFTVFAYQFATYFKFLTALTIPGFTQGESIHRAAVVSMILFAVLMVFYLLKWNKDLDYQNIEGFIKKYTKPAFCIILLAFLGGGLVYLSERHFTSKGHKLQKKKPNIIILSMDSARTRNMNLYGYNRENTPNINTIAESSYVFDKMMSSSNSTPVCIPAIVTGRNPRLAGVEPRSENLLSLLKANGYNERIFVSEIASFFPEMFTEYLNLSGSTKLFKTMHSRQINNEMEWLVKYLSQDERYYQLWNPVDPRNITFKHANPGLDVYLSYVADKLADSDSPTFVWIHFMETHYPFGIPSSMRDVYKGSSIKDIDQFDISILYIDSVIGKFRNMLKVNGEWEHSIVIVTAEHGSSFPGDLPFTAPYNALVMSNGGYNIPFVLHLPEQKDRVNVKTIASQVDIAPTILELIGVKAPENMEGESLGQYLANPEKLSNRLKISVQGQYFLKKMEEGKTQSWSDNDYINVFQDKYMARLSFKNPVSNRMSDEEFQKSYVSPPTSTVDDLFDDPNAPIENTPEVKAPEMTEGVDFLKYKCYGLFNIFDDPKMEKDLVNSPAGRNVLEIMKNSPLVKSYQDI